MSRHKAAIVIITATVIALYFGSSRVSAQSSQITGLVLDTSPAGTDELIIQKSGETRAKKTTRGALRQNLSGIGSCSAGQLVFTLNSDAAPTCAGDDDSPDNDSEVPDSITLSGGTLSGTNTLSGTLSVSGGIINLDGGTEGTLRIRTATSTPATCTVGDVAWDTDADTDGSLYICRATNTWKEVDDDGGAGGGAPTNATYLTLSLDGTLSDERTLAAGAGLTSVDGGANNALTLSLNYAATLAANPAMSAGECRMATTGIICEGASADTIETLLTFADPTASDKTITFPNETGTACTTGSICTGYAALASPAFTGTPAVPTAAADTSTTQAASTAYVQGEINGSGGRSITCASGSCDADSELYEQSKGMVIETPAAGDDFILYRAERALTITGIDCVVVGGTSVSVLVKECDANAGSCTNTEAAITCGTTNTTEAAGIDDAAIDAGDYIRIDPGAVTGSVTQLFVQITFLVAD